jgi:hypothetical protein
MSGELSLSTLTRMAAWAMRPFEMRGELEGGAIGCAHSWLTLPMAAELRAGGGNRGIFVRIISVEPIERGVEGPRHEGPGPFSGVAVGCGFHEHARESEEALDRMWRGQIAGEAEVGGGVEVGGQLHAVEPPTGRGRGTGNVERHVHAAAADPLADGSLGPPLERGEPVAAAKRELEVAVVDAPQLDAAGVFAVGGDAIATAGHAQRHGA